MRRNNINTILIVVVTAFALILPACGSGEIVKDADGSTPVVVPAGTCLAVTYIAPSGTANNIVFTFDKPYVCGRFANNDWWVAPSTPGGTVTITGITPAQSTRVSSGGVMNGAMINPASVSKQGWDADVYQPNNNYLAALTATLPIVINTTTVPISSVVKVASVAGQAPGNSPQFQFAAVLTVMNAPVNGAVLFRPSYFGTNKFQLNTSSIVTSSLGQVDLTSVPSVAAYTFANVVAATSGLQLDHFDKFINQYIHAVDNSYTGIAYGSEASIQYSKNLMRFASNDFSYSNVTARQALINYLQWCIDLAGNVQGGTSFDASGGGYGFGRKLPLLFAGQVLQNPTITGLASSGKFAEDLSFYQSTSTGRVLHGEYYSAGPPYTWPNSFFQDQVTGSGSKTVRDPMGWTDAASGASAGAYLACCVAGPLRYEAMAASMLGFGTTPTFDRLLLISNRVQNHGLQFLPDPFAPYDNISGNLGTTWGLNAATGYFFTGSGRTPAANGKTIPISHKDIMGEAVWTYWISTHDIVPPIDISTLAVTPATNANVLNWSFTDAADHYNIYRATDSAFSGSTYLGTTTFTTYTDSGLTTGNTYAYWVIAIDAAGNVSNMSNKVMGTPF